MKGKLLKFWTVQYVKQETGRHENQETGTRKRNKIDMK